MAKKPPYPKFDKSLLKDGTKVEGSESFITSPRDWEGYINRRGKDIVWETEEINLPELVAVIKAKGISAQEKFLNVQYVRAEARSLAQFA